MNTYIKLLTLFLITLSSFAFIEGESDFPISGPNCHDTALRHLKLKSTRRYIHNHEMKRFLKERCEITQFNNEKDQLGIIELVDTGEPMHGFVSLQNGNVLTKDGVLKRTLPVVTSFEEMSSVHRQAIIMNCNRKNIKPCQIEVKYYNCLEVDISLKNLEDVYTELTSTQHSYYDLELREEFNSIIDSESFTHNCEKKKEEYHSMVLGFSLANMSSRNREEQIVGKDYFKKHLEFLNTISCD